MQAWWCTTLSERNSGKGIFLQVFRNFWKDLFWRTCPSGCLNEMNQKKLCLIYSQGNNGKDVPFSAVADMWVYSFSKRDSITDAFLWKLKFYRKSFLQNTAVRLFLISCSIFNLSLVLSAINQFIHSYVA